MSAESIFHLLTNIAFTAALTFCGIYVKSLLSRVNEANAQLFALRAEVGDQIDKLRSEAHDRCALCKQSIFEFEKDVLQRISRLEERLK